MLDDVDGRGRRKPVQRTAEERASIVAESYEPGKTVAGVARKHGVQATLLSSWRTASKHDKTARNAGTPHSFAEIEVASADARAVCPESIEIVAGAIQIRLPKSTPSKRIVEIARALARS